MTHEAATNEIGSRQWHQAALEHLGDDEELLREVAGIFLANWPRSLANVEDALANGDFNTLSRGAHSIKSSVGNFVAHDAFDAAYRLELAAKLADAELAATELDTLKAQVSNLAGCLKTLMEGTA